MIFENWDELNIKGVYWSSYYDEATNITNPNGKWYLNNNDAIPPAVVFSNRLYVLDSKNVHGDGSLFCTDYIPFQTGINITTTFRQDGNNNNTFMNFGIYAGEGNYRAIGVKNGHYAIWGPDKEIEWNGQLYPLIPVVPHIIHSLRAQYWYAGTTWRWDYFLDDVWIAGHNAPDNEHRLGPGLFPDNQARIVLCYGTFSYTDVCEGFYGPIELDIL